MKGTEAKVDVSLGSWLELWKCFAIRDLFVENIGRTAKDVDVMILGMGPPLA